MEFDELVVRFPRVWHASFLGGWSHISREGLRPASDLLEDADRSPESRSVRTHITAVDLVDGQRAML